MKRITIPSHMKGILGGGGGILSSMVYMDFYLFNFFFLFPLLFIITIFRFYGFFFLLFFFFSSLIIMQNIRNQYVAFSPSPPSPVGKPPALQSRTTLTHSYRRASLALEASRLLSRREGRLIGLRGRGLSRARVRRRDALVLNRESRMFMDVFICKYCS